MWRALSLGFVCFVPTMGSLASCLGDTWGYSWAHKPPLPWKQMGPGWRVILFSVKWKKHNNRGVFIWIKAQINRVLTCMYSEVLTWFGGTTMVCVWLWGLKMMMKMSKLKKNQQHTFPVLVLQDLPNVSFPSTFLIPVNGLHAENSGRWWLRGDRVVGGGLIPGRPHVGKVESNLGCQSVCMVENQKLYLM